MNSCPRIVMALTGSLAPRMFALSTADDSALAAPIHDGRPEPTPPFASCRRTESRFVCEFREQRRADHGRVAERALRPHVAGARRDVGRVAHPPAVRVSRGPQ